MTKEDILQITLQRQTTLIVGIDIHYPERFSGSTELFDFIKKIIEITAPFCIGYKVNSAFFEALGFVGWQLMEKIFSEIPDSHLKIADAKRCDISSTNLFYKRAFFDVMGADALTTHLYFGLEAVKELYHQDKILMPVILPSQQSSLDFLLIPTPSGKPWVFYIIERLKMLFSANNIIPVVGATLSESLLKEVAELMPEHMFLTPGVGAQGGSLNRLYDVFGTRALIPISRAILYPKGKETTLEDIEEAIRTLWRQTKELYGAVNLKASS